MKDIPTMPNEFIGKTCGSDAYTKTKPRRWTEEEVEWVKSLKEKGYKNSQIAISTGRSIISIQIKLKRLNKKINNYNVAHIKEKYEINNNFIKYMRPDSICDVYAGEKSYYNKFTNINLLTNDINKDYNTDYNLDALKLLCRLYYQGNNFDIIDLDPFGSAFDCFDIAIKLAKKGVCITLGEIGHRRWKRLDYVSPRYGITRMEDFTSNKLIEKIEQICLSNKKEAIIYEKCDWKNISRVWIYFKDIKITSQWK